MTPDPREAGALRISDQPVRADFAFGSLDLRLTAPAHFDGQPSYCLILWKGIANLRGRVDADSRYGPRRVSFPALAPGAYLAEVFIGESRIWLPRSLAASQADTLRVQAGQAATLEETLSQSRLVGEVKGSWQQFAVPHNPHIAIYAGEQNEVGYADTDDQGAWAVTLLAPGPVRMRLDVGSIRRWIGGRTYADARTFEVPASGDLRLDPILESGLLCRLTGPDAWRPYRAVAELRTPAGDLLHQEFGEDAVEFPNLAEGTYLLKILPHGPEKWRPQWFDRSAARSGAKAITISSGGIIVPVTCTLEAGAVLRGKVARSDGTSPGRLPLRLWTEEYGADNRWSTAADGTFVIEGLPPCSVRLAAVSQQSAREVVTWFPGTADRDSARAVTVGDGGEVNGIDFRLGPDR